jgi:hypothetical protein
MPSQADVMRAMTPRKMLWMSVGLFIFYQIFIFIIWEAFPDDQVYINRWSWSSADAMALASIIISNYVYAKSFTSLTSPEANFMKDVFGELHDAGIDAKMVRIIIQAKFGDKIKIIKQKLESGKLTEEELIEFLKE